MESRLRLRFTTLDVFTSKRFTGNPVAVVRVPSGKFLTQEQKQTIAREFNYSETVIIHENDAESEPGSARRIDIFLTTAEIPFAGHPTIGAACLLSTSASAFATTTTAKPEDDRPQGTLLTKAGPIPFIYHPSSATAFIEIPHDVHVHPPQITPAQAAEAGISKAVAGSIIGVSSIVSIVKGMTFALVELPSTEILSLASGSIDAKLLDSDLDSPWSSREARLGTYYYVLGGKKDDGTVLVSSRMINGSFEDPATGSAASAMAAFLTRRLVGEDGREESGKGVEKVKFEIEQGVDMGRRSKIQLEVQMDVESGEFKKIILGGSAVRVMEGIIDV